MTNLTGISCDNTSAMSKFREWIFLSPHLLTKYLIKKQPEMCHQYMPELGQHNWFIICSPQCNSIIH